MSGDATADMVGGSSGWVCGGCGAPVVDVSARFCGRCASHVVPATPATAGAGGAVPSTAGVTAAGPSPFGSLGMSASRPVPASRRLGFSERVGVGWTLSKRCFELMKTQPGLLAVPAISTAVIVVVFLLASVIAQALPGVLELVCVVVALGVLGGVAAGGQAVIVARVGAVLHGGSCTNKEAFAAVAPKWKVLAQWGAISVTVAALIRGLERGRGVLGFVLRLVGLAAAVAWSALTFFMVPVIVFEDVTIRQAFSRSRQLIRQTWGEGVVGVGVLSALLTLVWFTVIALFVLLVAAHAAVLAVPLLVVAIIGVNLLASVASPVLVTVLYSYATTRQIGLGMTETDLAGMFRPRRRSPVAA